MYVILQPAQPLKQVFGPARRDMVLMNTVSDGLVAWTGSQTDLLADDWEVAR